MFKRISAVMILALAIGGVIGGIKGSHNGQVNYNVVAKANIYTTEQAGAVSWTLYANAVPTSGITIIELCSPNGAVVYSSGSYSAGSPYSNNISCNIAPHSKIGIYARSHNGVNSTAGILYYTY